MNGHVFQSANGQKGIGVMATFVTQYPVSVNKCVSDQYQGNLDNSIMEKNQGEMCFSFSG